MSAEKPDRFVDISKDLAEFAKRLSRHSRLIVIGWCLQTMNAADFPRHRARCRACNPVGQPRPLRVDGHEYRRRRRNRR